MITTPPLFVAVDLASVTTLEPAGLRRCLDTVFTASDSRDGLRTVFGALERVLVAHVTCDPFVSERRGMPELLRWSSKRQVPVVGSASFAPAVAQAIARRFGWSSHGMSIVPAEGLAWDAIHPVARARGIPTSHIAYLADNQWELAHAAEHGCTMAFDLTNVTLAEVTDRLSALSQEVEEAS